jgi:hypothetical protein
MNSVLFANPDVDVVLGGDAVMSTSCRDWVALVIRPEFFDDTAHKIPGVLWAVDDVWLSGLLAAKGAALGRGCLSRASNPPPLLRSRSGARRSGTHPQEWKLIAWMSWLPVPYHGSSTEGRLSQNHRLSAISQPSKEPMPVSEVVVRQTCIRPRSVLLGRRYRYRDVGYLAGPVARSAPPS